LFRKKLSTFNRQIDVKYKAFNKMDKDIKKLLPLDLWFYFHQLTQIPRPSKNERKAIEYISDFGKTNQLETHVDQIGNVIIRKNATKGMENRKGVILQAHLDMVPQKNSSKIHDFINDSIEAYIDGDWVTANQTTLGADNGIGVAAILAILASNNIKHGPIEALFTVSEEIGMIGAFGLKSDLLKGEILLNLDSEDEGELYIGCAGGADTKVVFNYKEELAPASYKAFKISIEGLNGGHSGLDIHLKRGNANKMMNRLLINPNQHLGLIVSEINGGNIRNAIPREAHAIVALPEKEVENFIIFSKEIEAYYKKTLIHDQNFSISITEVEMPKYFIDAETLDNLLNAIHICPNGVIKMSKDMEGIVETSSNLAIVKSENGTITISLFHRSSSDLAKKELCIQVKELFTKYGAQVEQYGNSPGWKPNPNSPILTTMKEVYLQKFGKTPEVKVIHAGLECGVLGAAYPHFDMISFGPTIRFPHSPDEKVHIESVDKFYQFLIETLKNIPVK